MQQFFEWLGRNILKVIFAVVVLTILIVLGIVLGKMWANSSAPADSINHLIQGFK